MTDKWQGMETYPREAVGPKADPDYWGPEVLVLVPPPPASERYTIVHGVHYPFEDDKPKVYVAHLEADMWLIRGEDQYTWAELTIAPTAWMPIPNPPSPSPEG